MKKKWTCCIIFILLIISFQACSEEKEDLIPEDQFFEILVDLYKTQGLLQRGTRIENLEDFAQMKDIDSGSAYNYLLKKHNISRADFARTMSYYTENTEDYLKMYDTLVGHFAFLAAETDSLLKEERAQTIKNRAPNDLWTLESEWKVPRDGRKEPIAFKIETSEPGAYTLQALIKYYKDDKSTNRRITLILNYADGTKDINSVPTPVVEEKFKKYEITSLTDNKKTLKSVSGWILDHSAVNGIKHAEVKDISLKYEKDEK